MSSMSIGAVSTAFAPPPHSEQGGVTNPPPHSEQGDVVAPPHSEQGDVSAAPAHNEQGDVIAPPHNEQGDVSAPPHNEQGEVVAPPHSEQGELRAVIGAMNARRAAASAAGGVGPSEAGMRAVREKMLADPRRAAAGLGAVGREHAHRLLT